jgi:hypothetical protein
VRRLSLFALPALLVAVALVLVSSGLAGTSSSRSAARTVSYRGVGGTAKALASSVPTGVSRSAGQQDRVIRFRSPGGSYPAHRATGVGAPSIAGTSLTSSGLGQSFNGLSDKSQAVVAGFHDTPPDQGLCVGYDPSLTGDPKVVFELVNSAVRETNPSGTLVKPDKSLSTFFADPNNLGDVRCFWDPASKSFYFTEISSASGGASFDTFNDVTVLNSIGVKHYQFDSSQGGTEFGDQPHVGYDQNALYISTDEFGATSYDGALLQVISKSQLVAEAATVNFTSFFPLSLGSVPILTLEPAVGGAQTTEYLLNSFPYDQFGNNNSVSTSLGLWKVTNDWAVTNGDYGDVTLTGTIIDSETYAFPVPAASTGTGVVSGIITSEMFLNPDDSRMLQVEALGSGEHVQLWASLSTGLAIKGDPSTRDGVAWFQVDPNRGKVAHQGYIGVAGSYLLYPAIWGIRSDNGTVVFTITSPTLNPSAAYSGLSGPAQIVATGTSPHTSFADVLAGRARWGDYSAATLDPNGHNLWMATEYIPPLSDQVAIDNWGTYIFEK